MSEATALVIGVDDIPQKDELVLRSLLRLLDGRLGSRLTFSESLPDCNVVFARQGASQRSSQAIVVRVMPDGTAAHDKLSQDVSIQAPLRMTNVMETLRACIDASRSSAPPHARSIGAMALIERLGPGCGWNERPCENYTLDEGGRMLVDFASERVHATVSAGQLIDGGIAIAPARWNAAQEEDARRLPTFRLRELLWAAAHRLGEEGAAVDALPGRYRLLRWPDAEALRHPGVPRLAALLTSRSLDVAGASAACGMSPAAVHWFLKIALALGIAVPDLEPEPATRPDATSPAASGAMRTVIGRLRERLKLW